MQFNIISLGMPFSAKYSSNMQLLIHVHVYVCREELASKIKNFDVFKNLCSLLFINFISTCNLYANLSDFVCLVCLSACLFICFFCLVSV